MEPFDTLSENSIHLNSAYMDRKPTLMQRKLEANEARDTQNLAYQIQLLNQNMERLMSNPSSFTPNTSTSQASECVICQGNTHATVDCHLASQFPELVQADLNAAQGFRPRPRNDPFSNTYNEGWRNHPKFSWRQGNVSNSGNYKPQSFQNHQMNQPQNFTQPKTSEMDELKAVFRTLPNQRHLRWMN